ncbi:MAG: [Fe-Fe] hydrogenase large subunit C-terminal domain-containing protein, partial [Halanaerobium sp.]|nr:[Fe-Fe] hydrogenase large subunit C-terminal domain-containing protein [Halanaerobium sp.]
MLNIVSTSEKNCQECYSCVRNCPVKAVKVSGGQAEIIPERCLNCGNCVRVCSQKAKIVKDGIANVREWLASRQKLVLILAPGFPAAFPPTEYTNLLSRIKARGFSEVWEVALGAQLISQEYQEYIKEVREGESHPVISSPCPVVENLIRKHHPHLLRYLAPVDSPMTALARFIHWFKDEEVKVIFAGPCIAKKQECGADKPVQEVLTFEELKVILAEVEAGSLSAYPGNFDGFAPSPVYRAFPISGGLMKALEMDIEIAGSNQVVEGIEDTLELIQSLTGEEEEFFFFDLLFCRGCIDGPVLAIENLFTKKRRVWEYYQLEMVEGSLSSEEIPPDLLARSREEISFRRKFTTERDVLPVPDEHDIR